MKVGVLGSGDVAKTLAGGFLKHGHQVKVGSRTPEKLAEWSAKTPGSTTGTFAEAARFGELIVLAVKGNAAAEALSLAAAPNLAGKTVIDACNPIEDAPPTNGVLRFFTEINASLMEKLQRQFGRCPFREGLQFCGGSRNDQSAICRRPPNNVHLRQQRSCEEAGGSGERAVWLGNSRHGGGRGGARHRAPLHALVHSRFYEEPVDARLQIADEMTSGWRNSAPSV